MTDHLVVLTGASGGLGLELARAVLDGAVVVNVSRSACPLDGVTNVTADLSDLEAGTRAVADTVANHLVRVRPARATVILNAATLDPIGFAGEVDGDEYRQNVLLNSASPQLIGHELLGIFRAHPGVRRQLCILTSGAARSAYPGWSAYGAGKAAVDHWVRIVGAEQQRRFEEAVDLGAPTGGGVVEISAIAPGVVATGMQKLIRETPERDFPSVGRFRDLHRAGALADPRDVARTLWAELDAGLDTGAVIDVRGR